MEMFRLYLLNLIKSGEKETQKVTKAGIPRREELDRRAYERFGVDQQHLVLMNEQDIFLVRDVSKKGFKVEVSKRAFDRLSLNNLYKCRMRYLGEVYECQAQVRWKKDVFVGFELGDESSDVKAFFARLILPKRIAYSLKLVTEKNAIKDLVKKVYWYHGLFHTNIFILRSSLTKVEAWFIQTKDKVLVSYLDGNLCAGDLSSSKLSSEDVEKIFQNRYSIDYNLPLKDHLLFLSDIVMASAIIHKEEILEDIMGAKNSLLT